MVEYTVEEEERTPNSGEVGNLHTDLALLSQEQCA